MALHLSPTVSFLALSSSSSPSAPRARALSRSTATATAANNNVGPYLASKLQCKSTASVCHDSFSKKMCVIVHASAEAGATDAVEQPEKPKPATSVEDMPLDSKQQMILEQRARMKVAKKLRQRRRRLVQKRHLRKKGSWPLSKMKKLKNV